MGMTFTRLSDDAVLDPIIVYGPYINEREAPTITHDIAESSDVRVTYKPLRTRSGEFQMLFDSYAEAYAASTWFGEPSQYDFDGPSTGGGYELVDGMVVWVGEVDDTFDIRFTVRGTLNITQNEKWELTVPFREVPL